MKSQFPRVLAVVGAAALCLGAVTGCSSTASQEQADNSATESSAEASQEYGTIIDVRTPEEFAEGHLEGAINIDVDSGSFADEIADLDPAATYTLYCRSGNRAGQAQAIMESAGFADVTNIGGLKDAAAMTGLDIVTD